MQENLETRTRVRNLILSIATCVGLLIMAYFYAVPVLRISIMTDEQPFEVKRKIRPLTEYLGEKIGMKVEYRPMRDSDALVEALLAGKLDLAWIDATHLAQARTRSDGGVMPIAQCAEDGHSGRAPIIAPSNGDYSWAVRSDMDYGLREKLTDAFLTMHTDKAKGSEFLQYQHVSRYIPATAH